KLEEIYVWEADLGQRHRSGARVVLLRDKLSRYKGLRIGGWKRCLRSINLDDAMKVVNKYITYEMDRLMMSWLTSKRHESDRRVFCSELIALTLQEMNLLSRKKQAVTYSPKDLQVVQ